MTDTQKQRIREMRGEGKSYIKIAASLNIPENTVKSYCKRNNLGGRLKSNATDNVDSPAYCKQCDKPLIQTRGIKTRKFCSPSCRSSWWKDNRDRLNRKAVYQLKCVHCGGDFESYGNKERKYCSHACYVADRFDPSRAGRKGAAL
jgi:endogenous inhibitor of DNA gyrase (YacG/DUF329 family)